MPFDLAVRPTGGTKDLASSQPDKLKELQVKLETLMKDAAPAGGGDDDGNESTPAKPQKKKKGLRAP